MAPAGPTAPQDAGGTPGTRPEGARDEREAAVRIRQMFSRIAPRYDLLNHLLSLSLDRVWRRRAAQRFGDILVRPGARVLDLCCGTGDLTLALYREARRGAAGEAGVVLGADFAEPMLVRAQRKSQGTPVAYLGGDALQLPFPDESFDLITAAFGFRNLANYRGGLAEMWRLLRPGGAVGLLEFSAEQSAVFGPFYRFYFRHVLPRVGGAISGCGDVYRYLPGSVARFPSPDELAAQMREMGFRDVAYQKWTAGIVALHTGRK